MGPAYEPFLFEFEGVRDMPVQSRERITANIAHALEQLLAEIELGHLQQTVVDDDLAFGARLPQLRRRARLSGGNLATGIERQRRRHDRPGAGALDLEAEGIIDGIILGHVRQRAERQIEGFLIADHLAFELDSRTPQRARGALLGLLAAHIGVGALDRVRPLEQPRLGASIIEIQPVDRLRLRALTNRSRQRSNQHRTSQGHEERLLLPHGNVDIQPTQYIFVSKCSCP